MEAKKLFNIWSKRSSTPLGRVAILKSLILSKLVYLWILLPNPPNNFVDELQRMIIEFVWDKKRDKIKRKTALHPIEEGGINIPSIRTYICSLKLKWISKIFGDKQSKWIKMLQKEFADIFSAHKFGPRKLEMATSNPFWKDVFNAYTVFFNKIEILQPEDFLMEPIFFNDKFKVDNKILHFPDWIGKGIIYIKDLLKDDGSFFSMVELNRKYNFNARPLDVLGSVDSIKTYTRQKAIKIKSNICRQRTKALDIIFKNQKGAKMFYKMMLDKPETPAASTNWERIIGVPINWTKVFSNVKTTQEIKLRWFQIKINNRILSPTPS